MVYNRKGTSTETIDPYRTRKNQNENTRKKISVRNQIDGRIRRDRNIKRWSNMHTPMSVLAFAEAG